MTELQKNIIYIYIYIPLAMWQMFNFNKKPANHYLTLTAYQSA